ncbi:MAG: hypothetical protein HYV97_04055 [Bdellovibrio sp.]|nr:hypothetical protein [Bdellovibrio sp.]
MKRLAFLMALTFTMASAQARYHYCKTTLFEKQNEQELFVNDAASTECGNCFSGGAQGELKLETYTDNVSITLLFAGRHNNTEADGGKYETTMIRNRFERGVGTKQTHLCNMTVQGEGKSECTGDQYHSVVECRYYNDLQEREYLDRLTQDRREFKAKVCNINLSVENLSKKDIANLITQDIRRKDFTLAEGEEMDRKFRAFDLKVTAKEKGVFIFKKCTVTATKTSMINSWSNKTVTETARTCKKAMETVLAKVLERNHFTNYCD